MKKIFAVLDFTKSLQNFAQTVTKLLELSDVEKWDGSTSRCREQKIREAALILAGECIALLLYNLSQSQSAQATAITKTKGWWRTTSTKHGKCWRQVLTIGNVIVRLHLPYVVSRRPIPNGKRKWVNQGFCPFLRWLGMESGITPLVWSTIAEYGTISSSFAGSAFNIN